MPVNKRYNMHPKKIPLVKKRVVIKRTHRKNVLSEIVIDLKTPVRTPGGRISKSVSDRISRSPGTKKDHEVTRLIVSAVPLGKQSLVEKRLEIIQEDRGLWARFKALVHRNREVAIGIAAVLIGATSIAAVNALIPNDTRSKIIDNIRDIMMRLPQISRVSKITPKRVTPKRITPKRVTPKQVTPKQVTPKRVTTPKRVMTPDQNTGYAMTLLTEFRDEYGIGQTAYNAHVRSVVDSLLNKLSARTLSSAMVLRVIKCALGALVSDSHQLEDPT